MSTMQITPELLDRAIQIACAPILAFEFGRPPCAVSLDGGADEPKPAWWQLLYHRLWCFARRGKVRSVGGDIAAKRQAEFVALIEALLERGALTAGEVAAVLTAAEAGEDWRAALQDHRAGEAFG